MKEQEFPLTGKLWFVVDRDTALVLEKSGLATLAKEFTICAVRFPRGKKAVAAFRSEEIAGSYIEQREDPSLIAVSPLTPQKLAEFVDDLVADGWQYVAYDPIAGAKILPLSTLQEDARKQLP